MIGMFSGGGNKITCEHYPVQMTLVNIKYDQGHPVPSFIICLVLSFCLLILNSFNPFELRMPCKYKSLALSMILFTLRWKFHPPTHFVSASNKAIRYFLCQYQV